MGPPWTVQRVACDAESRDGQRRGGQVDDGSDRGLEQNDIISGIFPGYISHLSQGRVTIAKIAEQVLWWP